jgi:hypothetical protein
VTGGLIELIVCGPSSSLELSAGAFVFECVASGWVATVSFVEPAASDEGIDAVADGWPSPVSLAPTRLDNQPPFFRIFYGQRRSSLPTRSVGRGRPVPAETPSCLISRDAMSIHRCGYFTPALSRRPILPTLIRIGRRVSSFISRRSAETSAGARLQTFHRLCQGQRRVCLNARTIAPDPNGECKSALVSGVHVGQV